MVVIMIGRNRIRQPWKMASAACLPSFLRLQSGVNHHDCIFFTRPTRRMHPTNAYKFRSMPKIIKVSKAPNPAEGNPERMVNGWRKFS